ncbi:right-handed parallel beta-helix repeat-containing protein [Mycolicibacterium stellerae]|uniref:right-handed parallel beta-helix repeat-containing protein n=1 Tax=Mycolicibacterium stellerae TaxID=2358193 RepID=UPI001F4805A9|nr:right-handed parallel beta-helix repeat-containing protein [Mycolicibacterium stellerae]
MVVALGVAMAGGAHPDADSTATLQAQFDAVPAGGLLELSPQMYSHSGVLKLRVPNVRIDGNGATLHATNDATSALQILADGVQLTNLTLTAGTEGKRWSDIDQHKVVISGNGDTISNVSITGSAAAGVFVYRARDFRIDDVTITGTRADGVHVTGGSSNGVIDNVRTAATGDDGVAVVSYRNDGAPCDGVQISRVNVASTRWGRGISVVGGRNISLRDFQVANTNAAGIYVATEGDPYFTHSVESVSISGGTVTGANTNSDVVQGAILITSENAGEAVRGVQISDVAIAATPGVAQRDVGVIAEAGSVESVTLDHIDIRGSAVPPLYSDVPGGSLTVSGWTQDGNPISVD